jgi:methylated-DNA-[protein]-cysteine S-methyltransferase
MFRGAKVKGPGHSPPQPRTTVSSSERTREEVRTPIGVFVVECDPEGRVISTSWKEELRRGSVIKWATPSGSEGAPDAGSASPVKQALLEYFDGDLRAIDRIPVAPQGSEFQLSVWRELRRIPPGATVTYSQLAMQLGRSSATRAVGRANATNPIGLIVPCHRVVGYDGSLTGYGGGLDRKRWLLDHEHRHAMRDSP